MAAAAGVQLTWDDFAELSAVVPLLARIYPNGPADVNHFHAAGGTSFLISELLDAGLLHQDVMTVAGRGLDAYRLEPTLDGSAPAGSASAGSAPAGSAPAGSAPAGSAPAGGAPAGTAPAGGAPQGSGLRGSRLAYRPAPARSADTAVLRPAAEPFQHDGGLRMLQGNLGRAVMKMSAVASEHWYVEAPAAVFDDQDEFLAAYERGELHRDFVAVVRYHRTVGQRHARAPQAHPRAWRPAGPRLPGGPGH
jgi:phosphogluconate dehydratase